MLKQIGINVTVIGGLYALGVLLFGLWFWPETPDQEKVIVHMLLATIGMTGFGGLLWLIASEIDACKELTRGDSR